MHNLGVRKGRGRELGRETTREGGGFPSLPARAPPRVSLAPKTPFPIPFKRLPRRLHLQFPPCFLSGELA